MKKPSHTLQSAGFIIFVIGFLLGILLIIASAWPDLEARMYEFSRYPDEKHTPLSCPPLMTTLDSEQVKARLHNPLEKTVTLYVKAQLSSSLLIDTLYVADPEGNIVEITQGYVKETIELQPGETHTLIWDVDAANVDMNNFIFAFVQILPTSTLPLKGATCGTLVLDLPFRGGPFLFYAAVVLAAVGIGVGAWLWFRNIDWSDPRMVHNSWFMRFIILDIVVGVIGSILGWWAVGLVSLVVLALTWSVYLYPRRSAEDKKMLHPED